MKVDSTLEKELRIRIDSFVSDVTELVRKAAVQSVSDALRSAGDPELSRAAESLPAANSKSKRIRRTNAELLSQKEMLLAHLKQHPGQRVEEISATSGYASHQLQTPLRQLLADGSLVSEGRKRSTRYYISE